MLVLVSRLVFILEGRFCRLVVLVLMIVIL